MLDALYNSALKPASPKPLSSLCPQEKGDSDILMLVFRVLIFKTVITSTAITSYAKISQLSVRRYCCSCLLLNGIPAVQCKINSSWTILSPEQSCVLMLTVALQASNSLHHVNLHNYTELQKTKCCFQSHTTTHTWWRKVSSMLGLYEKPTLTPKFTMLVSVLYYHIPRKVFTAKFVYETIIHQNNMK